MMRDPNTLELHKEAARKLGKVTLKIHSPFKKKKKNFWITKINTQFNPVTYNNVYLSI